MNYVNVHVIREVIPSGESEGKNVSCKLDMNIHSHFRWTWWNNQRSNLFFRQNSCFSLCFWAWIKLLFSSHASSVGITDVQGLFLLSGTFKPPKPSLSCLVFSPLVCVFSVHESFFRLLWKSWHVRNGVLTCDCRGSWGKNSTNLWSRKGSCFWTEL